MKCKVHTSPLAKRLLLALGLAILPLLVVSQTQAKALEGTPGKATIVVVSMADLSGANIKNAAALNTRLQYLIAHNPKAVKVLPKGCGCPAGAPSPSAPGFASCLNNCVRDVGVSANSLIMCGAACALAETPPGIILCAICVGVSITTIEVCALGCATHLDEPLPVEDATRNIKPHHAISGSLQATVRLRPARDKA